MACDFDARTSKLPVEPPFPSSMCPKMFVGLGYTWWFQCCEQHPAFLVWKIMQNLHAIIIHHKEWLWRFAHDQLKHCQIPIDGRCDAIVRLTCQTFHTFD